MTSNNDRAKHVAHRAAVIDGLRALASFLEANPDAPVPLFSADVHVSTHGTDEENQRTVDRAAAVLGTAPAWSDAEKTHYRVSRMFAAVEYSVTAITEAHMARYRAESTYNGCVIPDESAVAA